MVARSAIDERTQEGAMNREAFKITVPDAVLTDLRERLSRVRYPIDFANEN
jgi:hypothetical protein